MLAEWRGVSFTAGGTCVIDANQAGNGNFLAALQVQQRILVSALQVGGLSGSLGPAGTGTGVSSSQNPSSAGRAVTFTAVISPVPDGGTVLFTDPGITIPGCGAVPVNVTTGVASCTTSFSSPGSREIQAIYSGDSAFAASQSQVITQVVNVPPATAPNPSPKPAATALRLVSSAHPVTAGQVVMYTALVSPAPNGGRVYFFADGHVIPGCSDLPLSAAGSATCQTSYAKAGSHTIQAGYTGDSLFAPAASIKLTQTIKAKKLRHHKHHRR